MRLYIFLIFSFKDLLYELLDNPNPYLQLFNKGSARVGGLEGEGRHYGREEPGPVWLLLGLCHHGDD